MLAYAAAISEQEHKPSITTPQNIHYNRNFVSFVFVFLILIVGDGVQLCPRGMSATAWHIVPAPGDNDDGEYGGIKIGRGNRSTRRKLAPSATLSTKNPT
jgi:hypothetical protein